jgi:hypothetical protein
VRVDDTGVEQPAGAIDHRHLHPRPDPRVEAHRHALTGGRGQQQVAQVSAEHLNRFGLGQLAQALLGVEFEVDAELELPGPAHGFEQPGVGGPLPVLDAHARGDAALGFGTGAGGQVLVGQYHTQPQHTFVAAAEERERTV